jgi:hypothetical protein
MNVLVLIPFVETSIAPGSGVVTGGDRGDADSGELRVWFEGNLFNAVNLQRWADRVHCAAERMRTNYPTTAVRNFPGECFRAVAFYDPETGRFDWQVPGWRALLSDWLGRPVEDEDLQTSLVAHEERWVPPL